LTIVDCRNNVSVQPDNRARGSTKRALERSAPIEAGIRKLKQRLDRFSSLMVHSQVVVELPHKHGQPGHLYEVRVQITTPGQYHG